METGDVFFFLPTNFMCVVGLVLLLKVSGPWISYLGLREKKGSGGGGVEKVEI